MDLVHVGKNGNDHLIHFTGDGDRPLLEIYVEEKPNDIDAKLPIRINGVGHPLDNVQVTAGLSHVTVSADENGVTKSVCLNCIATYVVPRIHTLMGRVYVPKVTADK